MNIYGACAVLRRAWLYLVILVVVGAGCGFGLSRMSPRTYASSSQLFVATSSDSSAAELAAGSNYMKLQILSYPDLLVSPAVLKPVIDKLHLKTTAGELAGNVTVDVPVDQMWLNVTVRDSDAARSRQISSAIAVQAKEAIVDLEARGESKGKSPVTVTIVTKGTAPMPVPRKTMYYTVGAAMLGLLIGIAFAFASWAIREARRESIRQSPKASVSGAPAGSSAESARRWHRRSAGDDPDVAVQ